jgi:hypothetical protein
VTSPSIREKASGLLTGQVGYAWNNVLMSVQRRGVRVGRDAGWCCGEAIGVPITSGKSGNIF